MKNPKQWTIALFALLFCAMTVACTGDDPVSLAEDACEWEVECLGAEFETCMEDVEPLFKDYEEQGCLDEVAATVDCIDGLDCDEDVDEHCGAELDTLFDC